MSEAPPGAHGASYRDPHGFVFERDGEIYRQVSVAHRDDWEAFTGSGLAETLVADGSLIAHEEADPDLAPEPSTALAVLRPERVPFVSYPYEWSFSQLRDAALLTLSIQRAALAAGCSLRDATPFNVTFHRGRPVFLDTTSFGIYEEGRPWAAYRQFCEGFLAPLATMSLVDPRLGAFPRARLDGMPVDLAAAMLPAKARVKPGLLMHLVLHARSAARAPGSSEPSKAASFSRRSFEGLIDSLEGAVSGLKPPAGETTWGDYYAEADHYSEAAADAKAKVVAEAIDQSEPASVWDLGANTGRYARVATERGIDTVAFDLDTAAVDAAYLDARRRGDEHLLPLLQDLVDPSPALGLGHRERASLAERGPADLVLALALVHHIAIGRNVPLDRFVDVVASLGRWALVEWVPKDDPRVRDLLAFREDVFPGYDEQAFVRAAERRFRVDRSTRLDDSPRTLYLLGPR